MCLDKAYRHLALKLLCNSEQQPQYNVLDVCCKYLTFQKQGCRFVPPLVRCFTGNLVGGLATARNLQNADRRFKAALVGVVSLVFLVYAAFEV